MPLPRDIPVPFVATVWRPLLIWALLLAVALVTLAHLERRALVGVAETKTAELHRLASQRAGQHDAHMTALSAIAVAGRGRPDLFLAAAATITRFYPRIVSIALVPLQVPGNAGETRDDEAGRHDILSDLDAAAVARVRDLAEMTAGPAVRMAPHPSRRGRYLLVKRSPNTAAARQAVVLVIDAAGLMATDDPYWADASRARRLRTPEGEILAGRAASGGMILSKPLGAASQPLRLETSHTPGLSDLLPMGKLAAMVGLVSALFLGALHALRQHARTRAAEAQARITALDARLAHATRFTALGEMASGIAHELAQPLTAILAQAQAGRHLLRRGDMDRLGGVMGDTVTEAERATRLLERLRRWRAPDPGSGPGSLAGPPAGSQITPAKACDINAGARSIEHLMAREVDSAGARLDLDLSPGPVLIDADPVALEQVIFNLVRNALDAAPSPRITVRTRVSGTRAILEVCDDGPGVPPDLRSRLFEPFVTGKPGGTGLGLALSHRLAERMGGELSLVQDGSAPVGLPAIGPEPEPETARQSQDEHQTMFRLSVPVSHPVGDPSARG